MIKEDKGLLEKLQVYILDESKTTKCFLFPFWFGIWDSEDVLNPLILMLKGARRDKN